MNLYDVIKKIIIHPNKKSDDNSPYDLGITVIMKSDEEVLHKLKFSGWPTLYISNGYLDKLFESIRDNIKADRRFSPIIEEKYLNQISEKGLLEAVKGDEDGRILELLYREIVVIMKAGGKEYLTRDPYIADVNFNNIKSIFKNGIRKLKTERLSKETIEVTQSFFFKDAQTVKYKDEKGKPLSYQKPFTSVDCSKCQGTGKGKDNELYCYLCEGSGVIFVPIREKPKKA